MFGNWLSVAHMLHTPYIKTTFNINTYMTFPNKLLKSNTYIHKTHAEEFRW